MAGAGFDADVFGFEDEVVARNNGAAELDLVEGKEHGELAGVFEFARQEQAGELGHGFDDEDAGHDGRAGVVALEEGLVDGDVLDAHGASVAVHLDDAIDEQHGVAMGHEADDAADIHEGFGKCEGLAALGLEHAGEFSDEGVVEGVPGLAGDDFALEGAAEKVEIADEVEDFVADALVGEAEVGADGAAGVEDEDIAGLEVRAQAAGAEHVGFLPGDKRARGSDGGGELVVHGVGEELLADGRRAAVIKVVDDLEFVGGGRRGDKRGGTLADLEGLADGAAPVSPRVGSRDRRQGACPRKGGRSHRRPGFRPRRSRRRCCRCPARAGRPCSVRWSRWSRRRCAAKSGATAW